MGLEAHWGKRRQQNEHKHKHNTNTKLLNTFSCCLLPIACCLYFCSLMCRHGYRTGDSTAHANQAHRASHAQRTHGTHTQANKHTSVQTQAHEQTSTQAHNTVQKGTALLPVSQYCTSGAWKKAGHKHTSPHRPPNTRHTDTANP